MKKLSWLAGSLAMMLVAGCGTTQNAPSLSAKSVVGSEFRADGVSKNEIVVRFASKQRAALPFRVKKTIPGIDATVLEVPAGTTPEQVIETIKAKYAIKYAQPVNRIVLDDVADPLLKDQYQLDVTGALKAWDITKGDRNVPIAVIDTGIDPDHPDLKDKVVSSWNVFTKTSKVRDGAGHGTHTAGIAAAALGNGQGGSGVAPGCGLMVVQVLDQNGSGSDQTIADGIVWAADHGAKVMTMSLGLYKSSKVIEDALQYALDKDIVLCASAGNNNSQNDPTAAPHLPSTYPGVIEVAATDNLDAKASFSNWGTTVSVAAPGVKILSTVPTYPCSNAKTTSYAAMSGTSMASPCAAGVAGLIRSRHPEWNREQVRKALEATSKDIGDKGYDKYFGFGRVDALAAVSK